MESSVKERLIKFIRHINQSNREFSLNIGMSENYVSNIRKSITEDVVNIIKSKYPNLNIGWLMSGEGEMFIEDEEHKKGLEQTKAFIKSLQEKISLTTMTNAQLQEYLYRCHKSIEIDKKPIDPSQIDEYSKNIDHIFIDEFESNLNPNAISIYNAEASAGHGTLRLDKEFVIGKLSVPFAKPGDIAITAVGKSMVPSIQSGDLLVIREFQDWKDYTVPGNEYVIVTNDSIYIKVVKDRSNDKLTLHSYNHIEYQDFDIPLRCIVSMYKVIGVISQRAY